MTILYIWRADLETDTAAASLFGTPSNYKRIIESGFLLEGTVDGATWSTIASDQYDFGPSGHGRREGFLYKRFVDDSSNAVDWASYFDWQDAGNDAFRVTMTVNNNGTNTTYTQKHIIFSAAIGVPGGPRAIQSGSKDVDEIGGWNVLATKLYSTDGRMWFDSTNGIFAKDVSGKPAFGLVNGTSVNVTDWGGASETLAQGDMLLGDNNTGKANLFYDASAGTLYFRSGTTSTIYLNTSGQLIAGSGAVTLDASGLTFATGTGAANSIKWTSAGTTYSKIYTQIGAATSWLFALDPDAATSELQWDFKLRGTGVVPSLHMGYSSGVASMDLYGFKDLTWERSTTGGTVDLIGLYDRANSDVTIGNVSSEQTLYSKSIVAGDLSSDSGLRLRLIGQYTNNTGATRTLTVKPKFGSTTLATHTLSLTTSATNGQYEIMIHLFNTSTNVQRATSTVNFMRAGALVDSAFGAVLTAAEDTTSAKTFSVTVQWDTASASATLTNKIGTLELLQ